MSWSDYKNGRYAVVVEQSLVISMRVNWITTSFKMCVVAETIECCRQIG